MNNIYFLENDNHLLLDMQVSDILKKNHIEEEKLITYDLQEVNIGNVIMDLDTYSLFDESKIIYAKNATFLTANKGEIEHDIDAFTKYLENPNLSNILILSCSKADSKKKIVKVLKDKATCINMEINLNDYIKDKCKGYKISNNTINYLIECTGNDIDRISNELNKLLAYKLDTREIKNEDIDLIVIKKIDNNLFELIDAIISKNKNKALSIYQNMINYGEEVFKILVSLANQIRLIYQVKVLSNMPNDEITNMLNLKNPKQVVALRYKIDKYREKDLLDYLHKLSIMDEEIKTGKSIDKIVFPLFIANL